MKTKPSGRAIHVPQISTRIYGGIPGDHPRGNFLMISLRKWRGNEGEFSMWIFPPPFPVESLGIFPRGNFPRVSLKNFKMQFNDIVRITVLWKYPNDDLMSFFGELKCLQVWGTFPLILNFDLKISPEFPRGFSFHLQPKFPRGFPPPTTKIPGDSPRNPRDFARWAGSFTAITTMVVWKWDEWPEALTDKTINDDAVNPQNFS